MMKITSLALGFVLLGAVADNATAGSLLGQTVRITGERYEMGTVEVGPVDAVVGAGLEVPGNFWGIYTIDLSDTSILFTFPGTCCGGFSPGTFNGIHFRDLNGTIDSFSAVTIASNNVSGFNASRITFDDDNIYVNFQALSPNAGSGLVLLDVTTASSVPEPGAWQLMIAGAVGLALRRRRQTR